MMQRHPLAFEAIACRQIWIGVLLQACRDMLFLRPRSDGISGPKQAEIDAARAWVGSRDFHKVCALAGLDGTSVEAALKRRLAEKEQGGNLEAMRALMLSRGGQATHRRRNAPQVAP